MKILVSSIYHPSKDYCRLDMLEYLYSLGQDVYIVDNSNTIYGEKDIVKKSREKIRRKAIEEGYDYILFTDFDTIGDKNTLTELLKHKKDIISGVYWSRKIDCINYPMWWKNGLSDNDRRLFSIEEESIKEVDGFGLGCCLIKTELIKDISFLDWSVPDDDYPMCDALKQLKTRLFIDSNVCLRHQIDENSCVFNGELIINK